MYNSPCLFFLNRLVNEIHFHQLVVVEGREQINVRNQIKGERVTGQCTQEI